MSILGVNLLPWQGLLFPIVMRTLGVNFVRSEGALSSQVTYDVRLCFQMRLCRLLLLAHSARIRRDPALVSLLSVFDRLASLV